MIKKLNYLKSEVGIGVTKSKGTRNPDFGHSLENNRLV